MRKLKALRILNPAQTDVRGVLARSYPETYQHFCTWHFLRVMALYVRVHYGYPDNHKFNISCGRFRNNLVYDTSGRPTGGWADTLFILWQGEFLRDGRPRLEDCKTCRPTPLGPSNPFVTRPRRHPFFQEFRVSNRLIPYIEPELKYVLNSAEPREPPSPDELSSVLHTSRYRYQLVDGRFEQRASEEESKTQVWPSGTKTQTHSSTFSCGLVICACRSQQICYQT